MHEIMELKMLVHGLRALGEFARAAPVDAVGFARAAGLGADRAATLLNVYEQTGYALKVPHGPLHVPTRLTLELFADANPLGALAACAIEPVATLAAETGAAATLSIRRDGRTLCCTASQALAEPHLRVGGGQGLHDGTIGLLQLACARSLAEDPGGFSIVRAGEGIDQTMAAHGTVAVPVVTDQNDVAVLAVHADSAAARAGDLLPAMRRTARLIVRAQRETLAAVSGAPPSLLSLATFH
ncbi:hypothetical protein [Sphingomonas sp.]|jgi:hypothetical protein|uniref:hypothetical protein n=1 Tax=Sphingomonas sp. TaxID=28214 RepID=UPI002D8009DB|nr:hypothetical protein [Sphingomonas sp.]HEU0043419.1 hypothetical protein [Sphingomonas sp.]